MPRAFIFIHILLLFFLLYSCVCFICTCICGHTETDTLKMFRKKFYSNLLTENTANVIRHYSSNINARAPIDHSMFLFFFFFSFFFLLKTHTRAHTKRRNLWCSLVRCFLLLFSFHLHIMAIGDGPAYVLIHRVDRIHRMNTHRIDLWSSECVCVCVP